MNLDLFEPEGVCPREYSEALAHWLAASRLQGGPQRASSVEMYEHMWSAFSAWAIGNAVALDSLPSEALDEYLRSRGGADDLSARYAWRLLRLVDRVLAHRARTLNIPPNRAAAELLARRPDLRLANAEVSDPLPEYLGASDAKSLVTYLSAIRPTRTRLVSAWQDVRTRAAVGLMLGAGLTPGEVRALRLTDVVADGGRSQGVPWKLRVAGNGNSQARETPVAAWAGQLLSYWLSVRSQQDIPGTFVFPATRTTGKVWAKVSMYKAVRAVLAAAGVDSTDGGSFRLRHTFALRQLRRGKSLEEVSRWLGVTEAAAMSRYQRVIAAPVDVV